MHVFWFRATAEAILQRAALKFPPLGEMPLTTAVSLAWGGHREEILGITVAFTIYLSFSIGALPFEFGRDNIQVAAFRAWMLVRRCENGHVEYEWTQPRFSGWTGYWFAAVGHYWVVVGNHRWAIPMRFFQVRSTWFWRSRDQLADGWLGERVVIPLAMRGRFTMVEFPDLMETLRTLYEVVDVRPPLGDVLEVLSRSERVELLGHATSRDSPPLKEMRISLRNRQ